MTAEDQNTEDGAPAFDRGAESAARLVLALVPVVGPVLAEAVGYARSVYADEQDAAFRSEVKRRLATLESSDSPPSPPPGSRSVKISGDRARVLELLIRRAGQETLRRVGTKEMMETLGLTTDACRRAIRELVELGAAEADFNGNDPTGYARAAVFPYIYVEQIGRVDPSIDVRRELGLILRVQRMARGRIELPTRGFPIPLPRETRGAPRDSWPVSPPRPSHSDRNPEIPLSFPTVD